MVVLRPSLVFHNVIGSTIRFSTHRPLSQDPLRAPRPYCGHVGLPSGLMAYILEHGTDILLRRFLPQEQVLDLSQWAFATIVHEMIP
jgi:hypothetical protein